MSFCSCIVVFTSSLIHFFIVSNSLTFVFSEPFPNIFLLGLLTQMTSYNQEFCSQLIANGFAFFFFDNTSLLEGL